MFALGRGCSSLSQTTTSNCCRWMKEKKKDVKLTFSIFTFVLSVKGHSRYCPLQDNKILDEVIRYGAFAQQCTNNDHTPSSHHHAGRTNIT